MTGGIAGEVSTRHCALVSSSDRMQCSVQP